MKNRVIAQLAAAALAAFLAQSASAAPLASFGGTIRGTVTDPSGAVIPGATVVISAGHLARSISTDEGGQYAVIGLAPGHYSIAVHSPGFSRFERSGLLVSAGYQTEANAQLMITGFKQSITVTPAH